MTDAEFLERYKATLARLEAVVEDAINEDDVEIDYESGNDMLTLSFTNGSVVIISRQSAIHQLWMAARSGGFHYDWDLGKTDWVCSVNGQTLTAMLEDICLKQGGVQVSFQAPD